MGAGGSRSLERALGPEDGERHYGLENFGNTCYANSVLQALYACGRFREQVLAHHARATDEDTLLAALGDLFAQVANAKKRTGVVAPKRFIARLKKDNELFRSYMHQDAHEFLNYLLNSCCDILEKEERDKLPPPPPGAPRPPVRTWVHDVFEGALTNQTRCLWCETTTNREEAFLDLSLEIAPNSTLTTCLRGFSAVETLAAADKFHCDVCAGLQEAQKRMLVKHAPPVLALHLKRFKYNEALGRHTKLGHRVEFPKELKLCNTVDDDTVGASAYNLFAVVVHVGSGPNHGHYVSIVKSGGVWLCFDDDEVAVVEETVLETFFGSDEPGAPPSPDPGAAAAELGVAPPGTLPSLPLPSSSSSDGYILFYEAER